MYLVLSYEMRSVSRLCPTGFNSKTTYMLSLHGQGRWSG
jgi:hypothetical protein